MSYNLFLDDCRSSCGCFIDVTTFEEFKNKIEKDGLPVSISFDHDLGQDESGNDLKNGADCARWLVNYCIQYKKRLPVCTVHSGNPVGAANINSILNSFKVHIEPDIAESMPERQIKINTMQAKTVFVDKLSALRQSELTSFKLSVDHLWNKMYSTEDRKNDIKDIADLLFGED